MKDISNMSYINETVAEYIVEEIKLLLLYNLLYIKKIG
jgi:hypothetical protein